MTPRTSRRWLPATTTGLSVAGLGVSAYLTVAHYTSSRVLACAGGGLVNCERVTTSAQSVFLGIPVAVLGLAWFVAMLALSTPQGWRSPRREFALGRLGLAFAGMGFVLYLVYSELFTIRAICLWCTVVHVVAFALFAVVVLNVPDRAPSPVPRSASSRPR